MLRRFLIATILLASFSAFAQKRPFTFEDMMNLKRIGDFTVSPDSRWVAFSAIDVSLADNSKHSHSGSSPLAGGEAARLTEPGQGTEDRLRFSPDGKPSPLHRRPQRRLPDLRAALPRGDRNSPRHLRASSPASPPEADGGIWSPDGEQVLFLSAVWPHCPDDACNKAKRRSRRKIQGQGQGLRPPALPPLERL